MCTLSSIFFKSEKSATWVGEPWLRLIYRFVRPQGQRSRPLYSRFSPSLSCSATSTHRRTIGYHRRTTSFRNRHMQQLARRTTSLSLERDELLSTELPHLSLRRSVCLQDSYKQDIHLRKGCSTVDGSRTIQSM